MALEMPVAAGYGMGFGYNDSMLDADLGLDYSAGLGLGGLGYGSGYDSGMGFGSYFQQYDFLRREAKALGNAEIARNETINKLIDCCYGYLKDNSETKTLETYYTLLDEIEKQDYTKSLVRYNKDGTKDDRGLRSLALSFINERINEQNPDKSRPLDFQDEIKKHARNRFESTFCFSRDGWFDTTGADELLQEICNNKDYDTKYTGLIHGAGRAAKAGLASTIGAGALGIAGSIAGAKTAAEAGLFAKATGGIFTAGKIKAGACAIGKWLAKPFAGGILKGLGAICMAHPVTAGTIAIAGLLWLLA